MESINTLMDYGQSIVLELENEVMLAAEKNLSPASLNDFVTRRSDFWQNNFELFTELESFKDMMDELICKVISAGISRKMINKPAMRDQSVDEHLDHMVVHLNHWRSNRLDDEESVDEQARHVVCRAMLAYFTFKYEDVT